MTSLELSFADSHARLGWVRTLIARISPQISRIDENGQAGGLVAEVAYCDEGHEHIRYTLARPVPIPDELGFVVADIATNARSCLDMAIQSVVDTYGLPLRRPYFPIEDNIDDRVGDGTRTLFRELPAEFVTAITALQPRYSRPWGRADVPENEVALWIREISNANKHRNITPAFRTQGSLGFTNPPTDVKIDFVDEADESPWEHVDTTVLEVRYARGALTKQQITKIMPTGSLRLMIHHSGFHYRHIPFEFPVPAADFVRLTPAYVERSLDLLSRAHRAHQ